MPRSNQTVFNILLFLSILFQNLAIISLTLFIYLLRSKLNKKRNRINSSIQNTDESGSSSIYRNFFMLIY